MPIPKQTVIERLNKRGSPNDELVRLGTLLNDLITQHNALLAKLDLDAGVTDTNYNALCAVAAIDKRQ